MADARICDSLDRPLAVTSANPAVLRVDPGTVTVTGTVSVNANALAPAYRAASIRAFQTVATNYVRSGAANLLRAHGTAAAGTFLLLFDATALPAPGSIPLAAVQVDSGNWVYDYALQGGRAFTSGIVIANSSTSGILTVTISAGATFSIAIE